jgi:sugar phosphate permease
MRRNRLTPVDWIQHLQWPAMMATLLSGWLVAEQSKNRRQWGFWIFLLSNVLWVAWGWKAHAYALIVLQFGLAVLNIRGVAKNERT